MQRDITSRDNPVVKQYVRLASSRSARREAGQFITEGVKLTCEAAAAGYPIEQLFATEQALDKYGDLLEPVTLASESFFRISDMVADKLAQSVSPQGVFGVFSLLDNAPQPVKIGKEGRYLLLGALQDPGNLGTILRTAAAFDVDGVFLSPDCPDPFSPKVLRAGMGGVFKLPVQTQDTCDSIDALRQAGVRVYAATLSDAAQPLTHGLLGAGCAVVIGNEGAGLPDQVVEQCDGALVLPMRADSESLNAAMAAGVFVWEMTR